MDLSAGLTNLQFSGVAPNIIRELSGIYPTFVSAFKELVSNAYDADATLVTICFSPDLSVLTVEDNGSGMTPFEFRSEYIRIGGSAHSRGMALTAGGRQPIGRKGIGFLAVARYCHAVEVCSYTDRVVTFCESVDLRSGLSGPCRVAFLQGPFAHMLSPFIHVEAVWFGATKLTPGEYNQEGPEIEVLAAIGRNFNGETLTVQYAVDCGSQDLQATMDYDYLLGLEDSYNLETLQDFCRVRLVPRSDSGGPSFTRVILHLRDFVQRELQAPQRRGRVRNVASANGLDRFFWHLSRSIPVAYDLPLQELEQRGLEALADPISPTPFVVRATNAANRACEIKRPLMGNGNVSPGEAPLVKQPVLIGSDGLVARGYLLGFSQPIFPAELRGIAIRVRGVEIGEPDLLGIGSDIPVKYRPFLGQVMGEVVVTEGLNAISAIMPGREGFYTENTQFQVLRRHLVGDGAADLGLLGQVLERLYQRRSVESSLVRIVQEAKRRREAFLNVAQAVTALSIGSRYGRALHRLFSRSDIVANGLCQAPEHQVLLPSSIGDYALELADLMEGDFQIDTEHDVVRLHRAAEMWNQSLYILGRDWSISLRDGGPDGPVCEVDFSTDKIYLNWMHSTRGRMGDAMFVKTALFWRISYLAADGDVDLMMNLAHRLLSFSA